MRILSVSKCCIYQVESCCFQNQNDAESSALFMATYKRCFTEFRKCRTSFSIYDIYCLRKDNGRGNDDG